MGATASRTWGSRSVETHVRGACFVAAQSVNDAARAPADVGDDSGNAEDTIVCNRRPADGVQRNPRPYGAGHADSSCRLESAGMQVFPVHKEGLEPPTREL